MLAQAPGLLPAPAAPVPLFLATFRPDRAAPLPSPLQLDLGQFTITDASNIFSQANGQLSIVGTAGALSGALASASLARSAGLAVLFGVRRTTTQGLSRFGLASSAAIPSSPYAGFTLASATVPNLSVTGGAISGTMGEAVPATGYWEAGIILRSSGFFLVLRDSPASPWVLAFVSALGSTAVWPHVSAGAATHAFAVRNIRALQLGGPWTNDYGIALGRIVTTVANDTLLGAAYGLFEHTITAATGVIQEFSFRYVSDTNRWLIRLNQTTSAVQIIEVVAGAETVRGAGTATLTMTNGVAYRILVQARPSTTAGQDTITVVTQTGAAAEVSKDTYTGAATGQNVGLLKVSRAGANLIAWPRGIPMLEAA